MMKSTSDDYTRSSEKRARSSSSTHVPVHFAVHKPGCHFESCCGVCNLFPGVILIAFSQVLVGSLLLTVLLSYSKQYDAIHQTQKSQCNYDIDFT
ncbi:unnamed protein product [Danaus chrysippus]|uniref:(African queen) hypothetical protein n=1 Tax=Danaus chrysippus TaxID=151541 RepID=A0A8J2MIS8_9NEOP|nr:unnamed protein product [Danaus chrysippus]